MGWIKASDDQHYEQEREELLGRLLGHLGQSSRLSDEDVRRIAIAVRREMEDPTPDPEPEPKGEPISDPFGEFSYSIEDHEKLWADGKKTQG